MHRRQQAAEVPTSDFFPSLWQRASSTTRLSPGAKELAHKELSSRKT